MYPELFYGTSIGALIAVCILTATMLQSRSDKNDIMRVLKKINKRIKTNHKEIISKLSSSQKEPVGKLNASQKGSVGKLSASQEPVGNQATLNDIKIILLRIECLLGPSND